MTKDIFIILNIDEQIEFLNKKLNKGSTVQEIRSSIGIGEKALQKIIKSNGYKYNQQLKQYIKNDTKVIQNYQEEITSTLESNLETENNKDNTLVIPNNYKNDLIELLDAKNKIFEMLKEYEKGYYKSDTPVIEVIQNDGIKINKFEGNITQTSFKLHNEALEQWKEFCINHKEFSKQDLLSMALIEYIEKYTK